MKHLQPFRRELDTAAQWLAEAGNILLTTHIRPDGDAVGSLLGLYLLLRDNGIPSRPFLPDPPAPKYARVLPVEHLCSQLSSPSDFSALCVLDCGNPERVALPEALANLKHFASILTIDHHPDNRLYGHQNAVVTAATSTTEALLGMALQAGWTMSADAATALLLGLLTDCGTFRFGNTSAGTFEAARILLEKGARHRQIVDALHFREPMGRLQLQGELLARTRFAFDRRLAWTVLKTTDLDTFGLHPQDTENLIDVIRCIETVDIACLVQPEKDCVRLSLRSRSADISVGRIARELGGGGHEAAAGVRLAANSVDEAIERLLPMAGQELAGNQ